MSFFRSLPHADHRGYWEDCDGAGTPSHNPAARRSQITLVMQNQATLPIFTAGGGIPVSCDTGAGCLVKGRKPKETLVSQALLELQADATGTTWQAALRYVFPDASSSNQRNFIRLEVLR